MLPNILPAKVRNTDESLRMHIMVVKKAHEGAIVLKFEKKEERNIEKG
jgi:hypothetical protein